VAQNVRKSFRRKMGSSEPIKREEKAWSWFIVEGGVTHTVQSHVFHFNFSDPHNGTHLLRNFQ
jgi:hypothetical protein